MSAETLIPPVTVLHEHSFSSTCLFVDLHEINLSVRNLDTKLYMLGHLYTVTNAFFQTVRHPTPIHIDIHCNFFVSWNQILIRQCEKKRRNTQAVKRVKQKVATYKICLFFSQVHPIA